MPNHTDVVRTERAIRLMRERGLVVNEVAGWRERGRPGTFRPQAVIEHHDASTIKSGNAGALPIIISGRAGIPGPLSQWQVARNGEWFVVAAGTANHAGRGGFRGLTGNSQVWGVEVANDGVGEPYSAQLHHSLNVGLNVLLEVLGRDRGWLCGHKEWAPRRKSDPRHSMDWRRQSLTASSAYDPNGTPVIGRGDKGPYVEEIQRLLNIPVDGDFGPQTEAAIRAFQTSKSVESDGLVGVVTWNLLRNIGFYPQGAIKDKYEMLGGKASFLGAPITNELTCPDGRGKYTHFENGSIYWSPETPACEIHGDIKNGWAGLGWERSLLGYPITDEYDDGDYKVGAFQKGKIFWKKSNADLTLTADI